MNEVHFECVLPIDSDAEKIFAWRNDPETLAMSYHTEMRDWNTFYREFIHSYFNWPSLPPLFAVVGGQRIAFIRLEPANHPYDTSIKSCEISINVAPEYRGKGIGTKILNQVNIWIEKQGYKAVLAEIKTENVKSHKAFQKAGYVKDKDIDVFVEDTGETVAVTRYILELGKSEGKPPIFVIAEVGSNWFAGEPAKDWERSCELIDAAVEAGANAVKFQTFKPETLYVKNAGLSDYLEKAGIHDDIYSMMKNLALPYEMIPKIAEYCQKQGIEWISSFFSLEDYQAINPHVKRHKIASYEISHPDLIQAVAKSGKPLILSTGASSPSEIQWAVEQFRSHGGKELTLLQCSAQYPADPSSMNLSAIQWLRSRFGCPVGLSDHSADPLIAPIAAVAYGATVIEKHFTLSRKLHGPDHAYAIEPQELKTMVEAIREAEQMVGSGVKRVEKSEEELRDFATRALQTVAPIKKGDTFKKGQNFDILRSGKQTKGAHPRFLSKIEGKNALRDISEGSGVQLKDVEE